MFIKLVTNTRSMGAIMISLSMIAPSVNAAGIAQSMRMDTAMPFGIMQTAGSTMIDGAEVITVNHRRDRNAHGKQHRKRADHNRSKRAKERRRADRHMDRRQSYRYDDRRRYKRGHRGYRDYRQGYRRDNDGLWYPLAAFALGAIIQNQIKQPQVYSRPTYNNTYSNWDHIPAANMAAHDNWCDQRYRSYSRANKTFQPYNGSRKYCNSPYDRF